MYLWRVLFIQIHSLLTPSTHSLIHPPIIVYFSHSLFTSLIHCLLLSFIVYFLHSMFTSLIHYLVESEMWVA